MGKDDLKDQRRANVISFGSMAFLKSRVAPP